MRKRQPATRARRRSLHNAHARERRALHQRSSSTGQRLSKPAPAGDGGVDRGQAERIRFGAAVTAVLAVAGAWLLGGIDLGGGSAARHAPVPGAGSARAGFPVPSGAAEPRFASVAAAARGSGVDVYRSAQATKPYMRLSSPNIDGARLVFLVRGSGRAWAHVFLPTRPNGSMGWIRLSQVALAGTDYQVVIQLDQHKLSVWRRGRLVVRTPIGVGRAVTPTPAGHYYITELLKQPDPTGIYGPFAFGMSVHSNVLHEFAGRDGILGIHGTNFPAGIGTNVSHGCIRVSNAVITRMARILPLGTPVFIQRGGGGPKRSPVTQTPYRVDRRWLLGGGALLGGGSSLVTPAASARSAGHYWIVSGGQSLSYVAAKEQTSVAGLVSLNPGLSGSALRVGERIRVR